jgi:hypothetical protein
MERMLGVVVTAGATVRKHSTAPCHHFFSSTRFEPGKNADVITSKILQITLTTCRAGLEFFR